MNGHALPANGSLNRCSSAICAQIMQTSFWQRLISKSRAGAARSGAAAYPMNFNEVNTVRLIAPLLLGLMLATTVMAQKKSDREEMGLAGPVRSLTMETQEPEKARIKVEQINFDKSGNRTEVLKFSSDGTVQGKTVYSRDARANLVSETSYGASGAVYSKISHAYDASGRRSETLAINGEGKTTSKTSYTYDDAGRLAEEIREAENFLGRLESRKTVYTYDESGRLLSKSGVAEMGSRTHIRNKYDYDGRLTGRTEQLSLAPPVEYSFDSKGNITDRKSGAGALRKGPFDFEEHYSYEHDSQGNWVKQTKQLLVMTENPTTYSLRRDYKLVSTTYRAITYY